MLASYQLKPANFGLLPIHIGTHSGRTCSPVVVTSRNRKLYLSGARPSAWIENVCVPASNDELASNGADCSRMSLWSSAIVPSPVYLTITVYEPSPVSVHIAKLWPTGVSVSQVCATGQAGSPGLHGSVVCGSDEVGQPASARTKTDSSARTRRAMARYASTGRAQPRRSRGPQDQHLARGAAGLRCDSQPGW